MKLTEAGPLVAGELDKPFWDAWKADETFLLHRCGVCGRHDWPASTCTDHGGAAMAWVPTSGTGTVDTFTVFYRAYVKELEGEVPYVVAVVRLDEGPYFHTRIVGTSHDAVRSGMRVRLRKGAGDQFPLFAPE